MMVTKNGARSQKCSTKPKECRIGIKPVFVVPQEMAAPKKKAASLIQIVCVNVVITGRSTT